GAKAERQRIDHYRRWLQPSLAVALGLAAFAAACVVAPLVAALVPAAWAAAAPIAALLTVAGGLILAVYSFSPLVTVSDNTAVLQAAVVAGALTNVGLDFLLAPRLGTRGVALANVAAWSAQLVLLSLLLHRRIAAERRALVLVVVAVPVVLLL